MYSRAEKKVLQFQTMVPFLISSLLKKDLRKIQSLDIPDSEPIVLNGKVDELKYSKLKIGIETKEGSVTGFLSESIESGEMASFWGKQVTITGILHHKPGGKSIVETQRLYEPDEGDIYFSRRPKAETSEQQLERQLKEKGSQKDKLGFIQEHSN